MRTAKHLLTLGLALGAAGLVSCSTPKPECTAAASTVNPVGWSGVMAFATRFVLVEGTGPCAELQGDVIGMQPYHPPSDSDPLVRDLSKTSIAIRTQSHGELTWMNEDFGFPVDDDKPNAIGDFNNNEPDGNDFCQITTMSEARVAFPGGIIPIDTEYACVDDMGCDPAVDPMAPGGACVPFDPMAGPDGTCVLDDVYEATTLAYRWSNLEFYVTAAATGTQFSADLEVELNGCTATYRAIGMWPAVDCTGATERDAEGNVTAVAPLDEYCHPEADPKNVMNPRPYGSGINPDFGPITCDPNFGPVPVVNQYYGGGLSIPRCVISQDTLPALGGFGPLAPAFP